MGGKTLQQRRQRARKKLQGFHESAEVLLGVAALGYRLVMFGHPASIPRREVHVYIGDAWVSGVVVRTDDLLCMIRRTTDLIDVSHDIEADLCALTITSNGQKVAELLELDTRAALVLTDNV